MGWFVCTAVGTWIGGEGDNVISGGCDTRGLDTCVDYVIGGGGDGRL